MLPEVGRSRPPIIFSSVLLPAPLGPTTATISPSSIPNVTPATAGRPPKRFVTASTSRSRSPPRLRPVGGQGLGLREVPRPPVTGLVQRRIGGGPLGQDREEWSRRRQLPPRRPFQRERVAGDVEGVCVDVG